MMHVLQYVKWMQYNQEEKDEKRMQVEQISKINPTKVKETFMSLPQRARIMLRIEIGKLLLPAYLKSS